MFSSLMFYRLKIYCKTLFTNTGSWFVSSLKWYTYLFSPGSTIDQWTEYCFPEKWASWTSCFGFNARFAGKSSSVYLPEKLSQILGETAAMLSTWYGCRRKLSPLFNSFWTISHTFSFLSTRAVREYSVTLPFVADDSDFISKI